MGNITPSCDLANKGRICSVRHRGEVFRKDNTQLAQKKGPGTLLSGPGLHWHLSPTDSHEHNPPVDPCSPRPSSARVRVTRCGGSDPRDGREEGYMILRIGWQVYNFMTVHYCT